MRITGMLAFIGVPTALILAQQDGLGVAVVAMTIFGMGHGILTVSFGYTTTCISKQMYMVGQKDGSHPTRSWHLLARLGGIYF